jgi:ribosomal protein L19E
MIYLIDQNEDFTQSYSREEIQNLIDDNKIGLNTKYLDRAME